MRKRTWDEAFSSTNLGHTQREIKSSLWGRILRNELKFVENLIKPHLVDNVLVDAIEQAIGNNPELKAARDLLFENKVPESQMYTPMVTLLRHISTFNVQTRDDAPSLNNMPIQTPNVDPIVPSLPPEVSESFALASSPTTGCAPTDAPEPLSFPDNGTNHGLCINRTWVDTHASLLHSDPGLYISVRGIKDGNDLERKRPRDGPAQNTRPKVAKTVLQTDAATASHTTSDLHKIQGGIPGDATPDIDDISNEEEPQDAIPEEAIMDDRKPDISLVDLSHSDVVPTEYLWRQCALFMEMKKSASDGPFGQDILTARLPEGNPVVTSRAVMVCKSIISQMADNARILMATRPFLRFCLHIAFCGTNFNLALFDRNGAIISRTYDFETHLGLFIRTIRRLTCEMTAYDLGLDTTVRPEGCLGSVQYPSYLVKISKETWYRTEGVPLWQSTSLIGRGTLVFNARDHGEPNALPWILKNAWREDGRLKESDLYELMQRVDGSFSFPKALAKFVVGGDVSLDNGGEVTIAKHRARFGSKVIGNGSTVHRLVLASRGKGLASYSSFKQLLMAALGIVVAHKRLYDQGILHGDLSYGNTFLSEFDDGGVHGFLADLDLASIYDKALDKLPEDTAIILKQQREKGPRSGTLIFMAIELLHGQLEHLDNETAARKRGKPGPPNLNTKREVHHDLEALIWVLIYAVMIHNYNSLTRETDRKKYKQTLDEYFGHGSARTTFIKRHAMLSLAHSHVGHVHASKWFFDQHEQTFFIRCMKLIAEHNRDDDEEEDWGAFEGEIDDENPELWGHIEDRKGKTPDEDADDTSGTYVQGKATKSVQKSAVAPRKRPPVITHQSVVAFLKKFIHGLE